MTDVTGSLRRYLHVGCLALTLSAASYLYGNRLGRTQADLVPATKVHATIPSVLQLERLGQLTSTRVHVTDVLWAEGEGHRGAWLVTGDALLTCDVSKASIKDVDPLSRTATIQLPALRVSAARVDHEKTRTWSVEKTSWLPWRWGNQGAMRDAAMAHAQNLIETSANASHHFEIARAQTDLLIKQMYDFVGWKVDIEWSQ